MSFSMKNIGVSEKIYAIVGICLALLISVSTYNYVQFSNIGKEIESIAQRQIPLTNALTQSTIHQLEQSIAVEKALRIGEVMAAHPEFGSEFDKTVDKFNSLNVKLEKELKGNSELIKSFLRTTHTQHEKNMYQTAAAEISQIGRQRESYSSLATKLFGLLKENALEDVLKLTSQMDTIISQLDLRSEELLLRVEKFTEESVKLAESHERQAQKWLLIFSAVSILVGIVVAFLMVRRSVKIPLSSLANSVDQLASGNTDIEIPSNTANDELGRISDALRIFKDNLAERQMLQSEQEELHSVQSQRQAEVNRLITGFRDQIEQIIGAVRSNTENMNLASEALNSAAITTKSQAVNASSASEQASQNVNVVASASEELSASIREISEQVAQTQTIVTRASQYASDTDSKIASLSQSAQKIGEVISLIQDIAEQTNLLALNATIEAARAGEAGKGFAVVASEVKELANQTAKATDAISEQISEIQTETETSVDAIRKIDEIMREVSASTAAIAAAVEEQSASTAEISENVQHAAAGANEVNQNISGVNEATEENQKTASDVHAASKELHESADELSHIVDDFLSSVQAA